MHICQAGKRDIIEISKLFLLPATSYRLLATSFSLLYYYQLSAKSLLKAEIRTFASIFYSQIAKTVLIRSSDFFFIHISLSFQALKKESRLEINSEKKKNPSFRYAIVSLHPKRIRTLIVRISALKFKRSATSYELFPFSTS